MMLNSCKRIKSILTKTNIKIIYGDKFSSTNCCHKLEEVGRLEEQKAVKYLSGQCFLHKSVAYRGIILCSWNAKVFNKHNPETTNKPQNELYYQVLVDNRDYPLMRIQSNRDKINKYENRLLFSNVGLDYVSHDDIIPYRATNFQPIKHYMFSKLFNLRVLDNDKSASISIFPGVKLREWKKIYIPWLNLTQIHKVVKENICITAMSFYMGKRYSSYWWLLNIKIENLGKETFILQDQELGVYDHVVSDIKEFNMLGHDNILTQKSPVIQYFNYINLYRSRGLAWCYYRIIKEADLTSMIYPILFFALNSTSDNVHDENIDIYFKTINLCH